jgi:hypothetical protein
VRVALHLVTTVTKLVIALAGRGQARNALAAGDGRL